MNVEMLMQMDDWSSADTMVDLEIHLMNEVVHDRFVENNVWMKDIDC